MSHRQLLKRFFVCDLEIWPMMTYKIDLDSVKMNHNTENLGNFVRTLSYIRKRYMRTDGPIRGAKLNNNKKYVLWNMVSAP